MDLHVGESFVVPFGDEHPYMVQNRLTGAIRSCNRRHGLCFTTRLVERGVRIWRVAC